MMKKPKKARQTAHRRVVAADPETQRLIKRLRIRWDELSFDERRDGVTYLVDEVKCTIRGLAEDIRQPASTVRYYSKAAVDVKKKALETQIVDQIHGHHASLNSKAITAPPDHRVATPNIQTREAVRTPAPSRKLPELKPRPKRFHGKLPPKPIPTPPGKRKETVASLKQRVPEVIVEFIRKETEKPDALILRGEIEGLLTDLRMYRRVVDPSIRRVSLPDPISISQLFEITKPNKFPENCDRNQLAKWLSIVLESLDSQGERHIDDADRLLFPKPAAHAQSEAKSTEANRPLNPREMRLRQMAEQMEYEKRNKLF